MCSGTSTTVGATLARRVDRLPSTPRGTPRADARASDEPPSCEPLPAAGAKSVGSVSKLKPRSRWPKAGLCAIWVMSSLMLYSVLQERIMTRPYVSEDGDGEFFTNSLFLVLVNRLMAALVAILVMLARSDNGEWKCKARWWEYASVSVSNVIATSCQYEALKWLTFPTITIGKCAKMLPVMLLVNWRTGRRYSKEDFGIVGTVLLGCGVMIGMGKVNARRGGEEDTGFGFALMGAYLIFDAITSTYQESLFQRYGMSVYNQMLWMNVSSAILAGGGLWGGGGLKDSIGFVRRFPQMVGDMLMLSASAVAGQFAITVTIQGFGALLYAGVMTTRQFCSVLASDLIFEHGLTFGQWGGAGLVFAALFYKLYRKAMSQN